MEERRVNKKSSLNGGEGEGEINELYFVVYVYVCMCVCVRREIRGGRGCGERFFF